MSKLTRLPDELHARLKRWADFDKRTIPGQIEWMLDQTTPKVFEPIEKDRKPTLEETIEMVEQTDARNFMDEEYKAKIKDVKPLNLDGVFNSGAKHGSQEPGARVKDKDEF